MKKLLMTLLMLVGVTTFADVDENTVYKINPDFRQFTQADYTDIPRDYAHLGSYENRQDWRPADLFTISVKGGTGVWLSNYISNNYGTETPNPNGGNVPLDKNTYNMSSEKYGYIFANDITSLTVEKPNYDSLIHPSNGATTKITYTSLIADGDGNYPTVTTPGYFLGYFEEDAEIYLVMTTIPADGVERVDSYQFVQDNEHVTLLQSRQHNTNDIAGNVRVNFGIDNNTYGDGKGIGREFVAVYSGDMDLIHNQLAGGTGGPLPGVFFAGLLSLGTVFGASKVKRQKRA